MHENEFIIYLKELLYKSDLNKIIFGKALTTSKIEELLKKAYVYYNELIEWNKKINLTTIVKPQEFIERNIIDSLMVFKILDYSFSENSENLRYNAQYNNEQYDNNIKEITNANNNYDCGSIQYFKDNKKIIERKINILPGNSKKEIIKNNLKLLDIGSGAGLPGFILKIFNKNIELYSIESVLKKCAFQKYAARRLNFENFYCFNENIYKMNELPEVNAIITRAAFNINELIYLINSLKINSSEWPLNLILFLTNMKDANAIEKEKYGDKNLYIDKILMYKNNSGKDKKFKQIVNFKLTKKI
jgi:16S rRNA (guanine527-N7)-methyltransferase